jgi:glycerophosphoryl diester phosphodiesterase
LRTSPHWADWLAIARHAWNRCAASCPTGAGNLAWIRLAPVRNFGNTRAMRAIHPGLHDGLRRWVGLGSLMVLALLAPSALAFDLQGHRGARGLAPENTLAAFERALEIGVTTLELDIAITADGTPVISHEPALFEAITRDAQGQWLKGRGPLIKSLSLAQVQSFDVGRNNPAMPYGQQFPSQAPRDGQRIPTLASLFKRVKDLGADDVQFDIETKVFPNKPDDAVAPDVFVDILLTTIREAGMTERVMVQSFDWRTLQRIQKLEPRIRTVYLTIQHRSFNNVADGTWTAGMLLAQHASVADMVKASGGAIWSPNSADITADTVRNAQALGLKVIPWTVNDARDMDRLIGWGVDGLISDYPDRVREVMRQRGMPLPRALKN